MEHSEKRRQRRDAAEQAEEDRSRFLVWRTLRWYIVFIHARIHPHWTRLVHTPGQHTHKHLRSRNFLLRIMRSRYSDCFMSLCKNGVTCYLAFIRHFGWVASPQPPQSPPPLLPPTQQRRRTMKPRDVCSFQVKRTWRAFTFSSLSLSLSTAVVCIVSSTSSTKSFLRIVLFGSARRQWLCKIFGLVYKVSTASKIQKVIPEANFIANAN